MQDTHPLPLYPLHRTKTKESHVWWLLYFSLTTVSIFHHNSAGLIEGFKIRALVALAEAPGSVPNAHSGTGLQKPVPVDLTSTSGLYTHTQPDTQKL